MKKTGSLLKEKRESVNLSLSEVALATKINPKVLTAIESGDEAHLPAKTFLKGFVRSYALFLKMDVEEVLRSFQEETGGPPVERIHEAYKTDQAPKTSASRRRVGDENSSGMRTAAVVVIVLLIGLIIGVRELIEKYQREKVTAAIEPTKLSPLVQPPIIGGDTPKPDAAPPPTAAVAPEAVVPPAQPSADPEKATPPANLPKTEAKALETPAPPAPAPPSEKVPEKVAEAAPTTVPEPPPKLLSKVARNEIILEALDNVDVKMQIKGETKRLSLGPTQVHTIHSVEPVTFDFSDGGAVSIILNGHERGPAGELGKPKQITIP